MENPTLLCLRLTVEMVVVEGIWLRPIDSQLTSPPQSIARTAVESMLTIMPGSRRQQRLLRRDYYYFLRYVVVLLLFYYL